MVVTNSGVSLADKMRLADLPLATTPGGKQFALKALHPSEHTIKTARVPGGNKNSVSLCCDMVQTFPLEAANAVTTIVLSPNIVVPASVHIQTGAGTHVYGNFYNAAFGGMYVTGPNVGNTREMLSKMKGLISDYRITSQSATIELVAPALSDQGTITSAQYSLPPKTGSLMRINPEFQDAVDGFPDVSIYPEPVEQSQALLGTSAYTSKAREGAYVPLKLTKFKWFNFNDTTLIYSKELINLATQPFITVADARLYFPYNEVRAGANITALEPVPKLCGHNFAITTIAGTAANVALRVRIRQVVEITALPSTLYAPLLEAPLPPDDTALRMYMEVSAKLKDAYPASYNDLGTLFKKISEVAKSVLPFVDPALSALTKVPGPVGNIATMVKTAAPAVKTVGQAVAGAVKRRRQRKKNKGAMPPVPAKVLMLK